MPLRLVLSSLLLLAGLVLLVVAVLGHCSRLRRNRWVGVRTPVTLRSDAAFTVANRAAAAPLGAAGVVALVGGAVLVAGADGALGWTLGAVSVAGTLVLGGFGGLVGDRSAAAIPPAEPAPACAGACAGCELVAGCRPAVEAPLTSPRSPGRP